MIQINLLEASQARGRARRAPRPAGAGSPAGALIVALLVVLMLGFNGGVGWTLYQKVDHAGDRARSLQAEIKKVDDQIAAHREKSQQVKDFEAVLTNQKEVLRTLDPPDRLLWSEKINELAALIPRDVFLSDVEVNEVVEMVETEASAAAHKKWEAADKAKRGTEPEIIKRPVIHYDVTLTGLAAGRDSVEQFNNVLAFHKAMTTFSRVESDGAVHHFMDGFVDNVDFGSIESTTYQGVPVNKFVFKLKTINQGEDPKPEKASTSVAEGKPADGVKVAAAR